MASAGRDGKAAMNDDDSISRRARKRRRRAPRCIEPDCDNPRPVRQNWGTMSPEMAADADEYHHRCEPCHARWITRERPWIRARKAYECFGCGSGISPGEYYKRGGVGVGSRYMAQVPVCQGCIRPRSITAPPVPNPATQARLADMAEKHRTALLTRLGGAD